MAKHDRVEDPVARLHEEARWSSFTASWSRRVTGGPRWVRRTIIIGVLLILTGPPVVVLIGLLLDRGEEPRPFPSECREQEGCVEFELPLDNQPDG